MRDPEHPRQFTEEFRRRIVALVDSGKPRAEVMREHDLGKSTLDRWIRRVHACSSWRCACLLADLCNREIVGCSCGRRKDARLVEAAFSNVAFPLTAIEAFRSDRGPEFCNGDVDALLSAFGIERPVSRPGNPYDNAVVESTNRVLKREPVRGRAFPSEDRLRTELFDWVNRYNDYRLHSTLGYMTPAGFREAGLVLS